MLVGIIPMAVGTGAVPTSGHMRAQQLPWWGIGDNCLRQETREEAWQHSYHQGNTIHYMRIFFLTSLKIQDWKYLK